MEFLIGLTLALGVSLGGTVVRLDRDRAFYAAVALAIGTYYLLFAVMGGSSSALTQEIAAYVVLAALAVAGFRTNLWLVVVALVGHGVFDVFHGELIENDGVPEYWVVDCAAETVEVHRGPGGSGYREVFLVRDAGTLTLQAFPDVTLALPEIFA